VPITILIDSYFIPLAKLDARRTVVMLLTGRAVPAEHIKNKYVTKLKINKNRRFIFPEHLLELVQDDYFLVPSCIRLLHPVDKKFLKSRTAPSRNGIFKRDRFSCQYCGSKSQLTLDHVMPKSRGGEDSWNNLVTCCHPCNNKKANRTPEEAGMNLVIPPDYSQADSYAEFWNDLEL